MANKYFKMVIDFRKAVKQLPKNLEDAFVITGDEYNNITFDFQKEEVIAKKNIKHKIYFSVSNENVRNILKKDFCILLDEEQYKQYQQHNKTSFTKDIVVYDVELCDALKTIGTILEQELFAEQKILFKDNVLFEMELDQLKYRTSEEYKKELAGSLKIMKENYKKI